MRRDWSTGHPVKPEQQETGTTCPVQPVSEQKQGGKQATEIAEQRSGAPYRTVFTMKRMITARPTQPHITPITMAVTSPAGEGHARAQDMKENLLKCSRQLVSVFFSNACR